MLLKAVPVHLCSISLVPFLSRCPPEVQTIVTGLTFEDLITSQNGVTASRALVNVVIDQQIGQQIGVRVLICRLCTRQAYMLL